MKLLPKIKRQHITLTKFLGSGAFGEVFEGLAKGVPGYSDPEGTKVAVKVSILTLLIHRLRRRMLQQQKKLRDLR
jgi:hypothetical protein